MLRLACTRVANALDPRKGEFLQRWVAGESIARIAASAGMGRRHLSRRWRPQVLAALDAEIANLLRELRATGGQLEHEASESIQGPPAAAGDLPRGRRWIGTRREYSRRSHSQFTATGDATVRDPSGLARLSRNSRRDVYHELP
ncbi:MAG: hypothetical protein OXG33_04205 [Chloroflexi bacterium]|nr:hypothetical protein [Chloroflexota bacterium]